MTLWRVTIALDSPLGTPLVGPTLFGQICWAFRDQYGRVQLERWLAEPDQIWRLSDGFPAGYLPKPLVKPVVLSTKDLDEIKLRKRSPWVLRSTWLNHRDAWSESGLSLDELSPAPENRQRRAHNVVDRRGNGTLGSGGLFFSDEYWWLAGQTETGHHVDLYVECADAESQVTELLNTVGERGYGRDASTGLGRFRVERMEQEQELSNCANATRRMSLSRGVLTPKTMLDALWRVEPHFGRVGPELSLAGVSPFKRPVLLTRPGATYRPAAHGLTGRWLTGIHPERPEIGINGLHLAIPFSEAEG